MDLKRFFLAGAAALLACGLVLAAGPARAEDPPCFDCHDDFPAKMKSFKVSHEPAASGDCLSCHLDHKDEEKLMLVKEGAALCAECHDDVAKGASVHGPVADGKCTGCHNPHGSMNKKMLVAAGQALCDKCHATNKEFSRRVVHAVIEDGCAECHRPHASEQPRLLTKSLNLERLGLFEPKQADLCFGCHELEALTKPVTEETGFRSGSSNLHALHLNGGATPNKYGIIKKKEGQSCVGCHLPHTADQEKLVRTEFMCTGTFCYTMRFQATATGGTCVVGCHKPQTYSREGQGAGAKAEAPAGGEKPVAQ